MLSAEDGVIVSFQAARQNARRLHAPVRIQLRQDGQAGRQLETKEGRGLRRCHGPCRQRSRLGALYEGNNDRADGVSSSSTRNCLRENERPLNAPTARSKSLSHMSLIVQPAPRMTKAPTPKRPMYQSGVESGRPLTVEARMMDQARRNAVWSAEKKVSLLAADRTHCTARGEARFRSACQPERGRGTAGPTWASSRPR